MWTCEARGKIRRNVKKKQRRRVRLSSARYSSFISEICNYQSGRAAILLLLFIFSFFLCECVCVCFLSRLKISLSHTHTNRYLWSSAELQFIVKGTRFGEKDKQHLPTVCCYCGTRPVEISKCHESFYPCWLVKYIYKMDSIKSLYKHYVSCILMTLQIFSSSFAWNLSTNLTFQEIP